jgi:hypothetical protein
MRGLVWLVAVPFFFLNPGLACGPADPEFQYGAPEMRAAVEGDWSFTITPEGGAAAQVTLHVAQGEAAPAAAARSTRPGLVRAAHACGTRTLVKSAGACGDSSSMPLAVSFVSGDATLGAGPLSGDFQVPGTVFTEGFFYLTMGPYHISALVKPDRSLLDPRIVSGSPAAALMISRL